MLGDLVRDTPTIPSEDHDHCSLRNLIEELVDVAEVEHHATPGQMSRAVVLPFTNPPVEPDSATEPGVLQRRRALLPAAGDRRFVGRREDPLTTSSRRVELVGIVNLDPVAAVVLAIWAVELALVLLNHKIHPRRSRVVSLNLLRSGALTKPNVVFLFMFAVAV